MRCLLRAVVVAALALVGCGGNPSADGDAAARPIIASPTPGNDAAPAPTGSSAPAGGGATTTAVGSSIVPAVDVIDVNTGQPVALHTTIATDKPTLIWMWAPH
jgi:hypothetical protein